MGKAFLRGQSGTGFPTGWKEKFTGIVHEAAILKGDPVVTGIYSDIGDGMDVIEIPDMTVGSSYNSLSVSSDGKMFVPCLHYNSPINYLFIFNENTLEFDPVAIPLTYDFIAGAGFSNDGNYLAIVENSGGLIDFFEINSGVLTLIDTISCFSYSSSAILTSVLFFDCVDDENILHFVVNNGSNTTLECNAIEFNISEGTLTEVQSVLPSGTRRLLKLTENSYVPLSSVTSYSGYIVSYADGVWTKGDLIYSTRFKLAVTDDLMYCCEQISSSPYIYLLKDPLGTNEWEKLANPDVLPAGSAYCAAFSPGGIYLAVGLTASPWLIIYERNGDVFTKIANPIFMPSYSVTDLMFTEDGKYLFGIQSDDTGTDAVFCYGLEAGNIVSKINSFSANPLSWFPAGRKKFGVALDSGEIGDEIRVNLFPKLNNMIE